MRFCVKLVNLLTRVVLECHIEWIREFSSIVTTRVNLLYRELMTHYVDIPRARYLGNRAAIESFHRLYSIEINQEILYEVLYEVDVQVEGRAPLTYRYWFEDANMAMLFKLTWV